MNLQQFKKRMTDAVITSDNKSITSMGTDQLLDLFQVRNGPFRGHLASAFASASASASTVGGAWRILPLARSSLPNGAPQTADGQGEKAGEGAAQKSDGPVSAATAMQGTELWDESQYDGEFDVDSFVASMGQ